MIDIVIPLGTGSKWHNNELKYSIRSIEKHLKNYRNIFIIGIRPPVDTGFHINFPDQSPYPAKNIFNKVRRACMDDRISDNFLFMNDDHFFLNNFDVMTFPFFYKGYLKDDLLNPTDYSVTVSNTIELLKNSHPQKNFDTHTPIVYNKKMFMDIMDIYDWNKPHGYAIKSLYCNIQNIHGNYEPDGKVRRCDSMNRINEFISNKKIFSISDESLSHDMKKLLQKLYPIKSKFES